LLIIPPMDENGKPIIASAEICGNGLCNLNVESYENCPEDCIQEENIEPTEAETSYIPLSDTYILPESLQKDYGDMVFIIPFITVIIVFVILWISKATIAGKTLKDYLWPIKHYIIGAVLVVISQYIIALPLSSRYPLILNFTQALWILMVIFSLIKLIKTNDKFTVINAVILGILYSFIIHGLKISIRYFFYDRPVWYLMDRFLYGAFLVMITVLIIGPIFIYLKKKGAKI